MIHTYEMNGYKIAIDGNNGSIHVLDDITFDILAGRQELPPRDYVLGQLKGSYPEAEIDEAYAELLDLKGKRMLFDTGDALEAVRSSGGMAEGLKALCLHVAHDCNMCCAYCFASKGDYNSGRSMMTPEVARRAVDYLVENSGTRRNIEIDFFGGEPLLNFQTIKDTVSYARSIEGSHGKTFYFTVTTNGTLLNEEITEYINKNMDNVVISIDGRPEIHDAIRFDRAGKGTYDRIMPAALKLVQSRGDKSYYIRGTFTSANKDFTKDVMHLADKGFCEISLEPVVGSGMKLFIKEDDLQEILDEYEKLALIYLDMLRKGSRVRFYHFALDLYEGPCIYKRITACGAGYEYFAVSPEGHLYPCHQFVGRPEFIMGDIFNGHINEGINTEFKNNNILTKDVCKRCWAKTFCSGGCHANAWYSNGDITKPNETACILQKKRIECAVMIQAAIEEDKNKNRETGV
ncbi:MAG: thioether cross-link-forming SCIFF peptide maturase [Eubacteriales bacterium]|nr:thioether cross-link-forming SCIFF peptide maturase [Eubacteriales bacterium]